MNPQPGKNLTRFSTIEGSIYNRSRIAQSFCDYIYCTLFSSLQSTSCGGGGGVGHALCNVHGTVRSRWGWGEWVIKVFLPRLYTLKYTKFCVCDASRLLRSRLFQHCCVFSHCVTKMPSRRMQEDAKTQKPSRLPSSGYSPRQKEHLEVTLHIWWYKTLS